MGESAARVLERLEACVAEYGPGLAGNKRSLLGELGARSLPDADAVQRLHECLGFLRAYPDDRPLLRLVERMLAAFADRKDLQRFSNALSDTGIAGTPIHYSFYWSNAQWLAERCPDELTVDWKEFEGTEKLEKVLHLLAHYCETPALDELGFPLRDWIDRLKGPEETDGAFLVRRFAALTGDSFLRETFFESFEIPFRVAPSERTPSRTRAKLPRAKVTFQSSPLDRTRPQLTEDIQRPPVSVTPVPAREATRLIDMAREAMITRSRDLDIFVNADRNDVRMIDCGDGLQFACMGAIPERRLLLEAVYGFLTLKNGVPIGYVLNSALYGSAGVAYNVFETYRGGEAARIYGRVLAALHHVFGVDAFSIDPYQLGYGNQEGLKSGAWWFYYKLGFRPVDPDVRKALKAELRKIKVNPKHRSSTATLSQLASEHLFWHRGDERADVLGRFSGGNVSLRISRYLAERFGSDRETAVRTLAAEAAERLELSSLRDLSRGERLAWERWSPLVAIVPGLSDWPREALHGLRDTIRAKGGPRESEFVTAFDRHRELRTAILELAEEE